MVSRPLGELLRHPKYGDSGTILGAVIRRATEAIVWAESRLSKRPGRIGVVLQEQASEEDVVFLLRSGPVRYRLAGLLSALTEPNSETNVEGAYRALCLPFHAYVEAAREHSGTDRLSHAGFDLGARLTEPYPYVTSAWRDSAYVGPTGWSESRSVEQMFTFEMGGSVGRVRCVLRPVEEEYLQRFGSSLAGLSNIDPGLARDVAANVRHVCLIDFPGYESRDDSEYREIGQSVSSHMVPGCCFFSIYSVACGDRLAEALYHEALHKKLSNLIETKSIMKRGYDAARAPCFLSDWNKSTRWNSNRWEFDRALYAYHVYVHLYVLYCDQTVSDAGTFSKEWIAKRRSVVNERQTALGEWLESHREECLGMEGEGLLEFLKAQARATEW